MVHRPSQMMGHSSSLVCLVLGGFWLLGFFQLTLVLKTSKQQFLALIIQEYSAFLLTCFMSFPCEGMPV